MTIYTKKRPYASFLIEQKENQKKLKKDLANVIWISIMRPH